MSLPLQISKLIPSLASNNNAEVLAVRDAIGRLLAASGLDWHDLAACCRPAETARPTARTKSPRLEPVAEMAWACRSLDRGSLSAAERAFVVEMSAPRLGRPPTARQIEWLRGIYERLSARCAA